MTVSHCSIANVVIFSFLSGARQILSEWFVPAVLTQFCPQGNEKVFHGFCDWSRKKENIWTAAAARWTKENLRQEVDFMTVNIPKVCYANLDTIYRLLCLASWAIDTNLSVMGMCTLYKKSLHWRCSKKVLIFVYSIFHCLHKIGEGILQTKP